MKTKILILTLISLLALTACQQPANPAVATVSPATQPTTALAATDTPQLAPTTAVEPAATQPAEPASAAVDSADQPASTIFDIAWDDRSPFAAGLVTGQQSVLEQRPGASVYHLDVTLGDDMTSLHGREEVRYTNTEDVPLDSVVFRLFPNLTGGSISVSNLTVNGQPGEPVYSLEDSVMTVPLAEPLQPGQQAVIAMDFDVIVPIDPETSNYGTFASFDDVLALAHFYPMIAVYDDEGWNLEIAPPEGDVVYADSS